MPKPARRRTDNVLTMRTQEPVTTAAIASAVSDRDVATRAFELYCDRGRQDGHDVDDWLNAERELQETARSSAA